jgi:hypothetical protein
MKAFYSVTATVRDIFPVFRDVKYAPLERSSGSTYTVRAASPRK